MNEILVGSAVFTLIVLALAVIVIAARSMVLPTHDVAVIVNGKARLVAKTGQKLLGVLTDGGIPVPSACAGTGICGLCRVVVKTGGGVALPTEIALLTKQEVGRGTRLSCQVTMRNDMEVEVSSDIFGVENFECVVSDTDMLSPLVREIVLDLPEDQPFEFHAGAFVQITAPAYRRAYSDFQIAPEYRAEWDRLGLVQLVAHGDGPVSRAYSIANTPADRSRIVLFVRLAVPPPRLSNVMPGIVSSYLFGLTRGDKVTVAGPYGTFGVVDSQRELVFIGGGVGMAPLRAIIHDQLERVGNKRKISFWYGARNEIDLFHADNFDALADMYGNFSWTVALSDPSVKGKWNGPSGFIHDVVYENYLRSHPAPEECEYYLCGPPLMIQAVLTMLDECGVDEDSIFNDDFGGLAQ